MVLSFSSAAHDGNARHESHHDYLTVQGVYAANNCVTGHLIINMTMIFTALFRHTHTVDSADSEMQKDLSHSCDLSLLRNA